MKSPATVFILISVLFVSGCVHSLNPLYTESDLTSDPALVGTWIDAETGESWTISDCEMLKYSLVHIDSDGRRGEYDARLVRVGDKLFLDTMPVKASTEQNDLYRNRFIGMHTFVHVVIKNSTIQISYLEPRWLKDFVADNPTAVRHEKTNGEIILTSSPKETQKFLLEHMTARGAFSQPSELRRKRGAS
jgi:hypothetical protein